MDKNKYFKPSGDYSDPLDQELDEERNNTSEIASDNALLLAFTERYISVENQKEATELLEFPDLRRIFSAFCIAGPDPLTPWLHALHREGYEMRVTTFGTMALFVRQKRSTFRLREACDYSDE